ncbi:MAG: monomethylamine:corrinoid methyltransferase [Actinobacteria bacterium]|nr:monomethylamine:corrinoid methyltransferase [Actinomycetota bacterium]
MISILEFQRRSETGPVMEVNDFDMLVGKRMREIVKKHGITYNPEELVVDDETADKVFQAAVEYLSTVGLYNVSTFRQIQFTKEEIEEIARDYRENRRQQVFGTGKEEILIEPRTGQDSRPPLAMVGGTGPIQEDWHIAFTRNLAQEPTNRGMGFSGGIKSVGGIEPKAGTVSELYCALWEQEALLEALRQAGREGMHLGVLATVFTFGGVAAVMQNGLRNKHNTQLGIHLMAEQKLDYSRLLTAYFCEQNDMQPWTSATAIIGGLTGGPAGTAVGLLGNLMGQLSFGHGNLGSLFTSHLGGHGGTREACWVYSAAARAAERNIHVPIGGTAGANHFFRGTRVTLYQQIASMITNTASGMAYLWAVGTTGLETRVAVDAMQGIAGMPRDKVNALLNTIMVKIDEAKQGLTPSERYRELPEFYDLKTVKPLPEFLATVKQATEELADMGVPYSSGLVLD